MPKMKKSEEAEFLDCISENIRICCKLFGVEKLAMIMGISKPSVYKKIESPANVKIPELIRLSIYIGTDLNALIRPLQLTGNEVKN